MILNYRRRNPELGLTELWHRLRKKGYTRRSESLYRTMKKLGLLSGKLKLPKHKPKPYEQMTRPGERVQIDVKVVPRKCIADPEMKLYQYTAIDEFMHMRFLYAYEEQSTYSSADLAERVVKWFKRRGITVECIQTDNGFEFTNRFSPAKKDKPTLFECTLARLGVKHKLIRPYTPRHNGKVERSHREDHNKFYSWGCLQKGIFLKIAKKRNVRMRFRRRDFLKKVLCKQAHSCHRFYSCADLNVQLAARLGRTNNLPMRPLGWLSPIEFFKNFVQYH